MRCGAVRCPYQTVPKCLHGAHISTLLYSTLLYSTLLYSTSSRVRGDRVKRDYFTNYNSEVKSRRRLLPSMYMYNRVSEAGHSRTIGLDSMNTMNYLNLNDTPGSFKAIVCIQCSTIRKGILLFPSFPTGCW